MKEFGNYLNSLSEVTLVGGCIIIALVRMYGLYQIDHTIDKD